MGRWSEAARRCDAGGSCLHGGQIMVGILQREYGPAGAKFRRSCPPDPEPRPAHMVSLQIITTINSLPTFIIVPLSNEEEEDIHSYTLEREAHARANWKKQKAFCKKGKRPPQKKKKKRPPQQRRPERSPPTSLVEPVLIGVLVVGTTAAVGWLSRKVTVQGE